MKSSTCRPSGIGPRWRRSGDRAGFAAADARSVAPWRPGRIYRPERRVWTISRPAAPDSETANKTGLVIEQKSTWLRSYPLRRFLAEVTDVNEVRIDLASELDDRRKYDFELVLPRAADRATKREIMLRGAEEYFKITVMRENRACDVYVVTATDQTPPEYAEERQFYGVLMVDEQRL